MTTDTDQPRSPAGSPDGGQFTSKPGGSEADGATLAPPAADPTRLAAIRAASQAADRPYGAALLQIRAQQKSAGAAKTAGSVAIAKAVCAATERLEWDWCGDGDAPNILGQPTVKCSHTDGELVPLDEFGDTHGGLGDELYDDPVIGDMIGEEVMMEASVQGFDPGVLHADYSRDRGNWFYIDLPQEEQATDVAA